MDPKSLAAKGSWKSTGFTLKGFERVPGNFIAEEQTKEWTWENNTDCSGQEHACISRQLITNLLAYTSQTGREGAHIQYVRTSFMNPWEKMA